MILVEKKRIEHIPVLHIVKQKQFSDRMPLIIFLHGFTSTKERNMHYAYLFAEKGFRVIMPEAKYHGNRSEGLSEAELGYHFWDIVIKSIEELSTIKQELVKEGLVDLARIGVAGTSMGGITTLGALAKYEWIKAGVSLMGNPSFEEFALWQMNEMEKRNIQIGLSQEQVSALLNQLKKYDLSLQPEKLNNRPLLFWHGKLDPVVPYQSAYDFYEQNRKSYEGTVGMFEFITDENAGHNVSNAGVEATAKWFEKHI
ncbi:alpha/beta fold hydrolase [Mesobacillus selenatarsenatis]|uniref:Putative hydrolase of the alpha/beta superfamily n=1 Tax=Mesobacillus selenatarsenatis (strain DSM 18680 / JCM 14380 / FERM P-15431 / SF-1) TaxID=1321606 RepID=A0A0A8X9H5_MESS1|nr:alpha/beta fold hydrolase [Mesobacillus selenatarsenatis]GAM15687.1 putative hydrolase of the alpha/beta superfamily [Mesobacillus selenatarsenatis SF-1]